MKGLGLPALKQFDVVGKLKEACTNGAVSERQGSLFALECLADRLGLLFEPYVITVVPALLKSFSHASDNVRDAAAGAARAIMSRLSAHGVKQMLAPVLNSLAEESQWKVGNCMKYFQNSHQLHFRIGSNTLCLLYRVVKRPSVSWELLRPARRNSCPHVCPKSFPDWLKLVLTHIQK